MPGSEFIGQEEIEEINKVFTENKGILYRYGTQTSRVRAFENAFAETFRVKYAHAVSSGSAALKLSLQALGVKPGDEVITQAHTFIATVEAICEVGATPVIVDIDKSLNMDVNELEHSITSKTRVVIPVHMSGVACDMKRINKVCEQCGNNIKILEDNAQSPGGTFKSQFLGTIGDVGIFSFDYGKMLTTGEGGMVITNNEDIYKKVRGLSDHGHAFNPSVPRGRDEAIGIGFNYKMMELQGALGLVQLRRLREIIAYHRINKQSFLKELNGIVELRQRPDPNGDIGASVSFFLKDEEQANEFVKRWTSKGYGLFNIPDAMRWHNAWYWSHIPIKKIHSLLYSSNELLSRTIAIPVRAKMSEEEIKIQCSTIKEIVGEI